MTDYTFSPGWQFRPDDILASESAMEDDGLLVSADGGSPSFRGAWAAAVARGETAFLASTVEPNQPPAYRQQNGVCTSMLYRSLQDCLHWDREKFGGLSRAGVINLAFEPLYGGSRSVIGRGRLGNSPGSIGAWVAEWVARYGVVERGNYSGTDLTKPNESLAVYWGQPGGGTGISTQITELGKRHRFKAHRCRTVDELADALASGCFGGICRSHYCSYIDSDGFGVFANLGGHHTCLRGVFLDSRNRRVFVEQQTHGTGVPDPRPMAHTHDGTVYLSDGSYLVREADIERFMAAGEVWVFQCVEGGEIR